MSCDACYGLLYDHILKINTIKSPILHIIKYKKLKTHLPEIIQILLPCLTKIDIPFFNVAHTVLHLEAEKQFSEELKTKKIDTIISENFGFKYSILWGVIRAAKQDLQKDIEDIIVDFFNMGFLSLREGRRSPHTNPTLDHYMCWTLYTLFSVSEQLLSTHQLHIHSRVEEANASESPFISSSSVLVDGIDL